MGVLGRYDDDRDELRPVTKVVKRAWRYDETSETSENSGSSETELLDLWYD